MLLALALLAIVPGFPEVPVLASDTRFAPGTEDMAVARTVGGIASYTRWPEPPPTLRICVSGAARHADRLGEAARTAGRPVTVRRLGVGTALAGCDLLYLGAMRPAENLGMIRAMHGRAILSIAGRVWHPPDRLVSAAVMATAKMDDYAWGADEVTFIAHRT